MTELRLSDAAIRAVWMRRSLSREEAARQLGCCVSTLKRRAEKLGLPGRKNLVSDDAIRAVWLDDSLRREEMEAKLGLAQNCIWRRARAMGLPPRSRRRKGFAPFDKALFRRMWLAGVSATDIGSVIGRHRTVVNDIAARLGLPVRPHGAARFPLADFLQDELARSMAARALREMRAMKIAGVMADPGSNVLRQARQQLAAGEDQGRRAA